MPAFSLRLTVRHGESSVRIEVRLARPLPWSAVRAEVCRAAGIAAESVLYRGLGAVEDSWIVGAPPLLTGCALATAPDNDIPSHSPLVLVVVAGQDAGLSVPIDTRVIVVGRSERADLRLTDAASSWRHASITPVQTGLSVADLGSTNGVFVDGRAVDVSTVATTGSVIRIGNSVLQIQLATEPPGPFRPDGQGHVVRVGRPAPVAEQAAGVPAPPDEPQAPQRRSLPLLSALMGAAVGGVLAAVLHNLMFVAFAALGPITMVGSGISDRVRGRRSHRRQWRDYRADLAVWQEAAAAAASAARRGAWRRWPGPAELARRAEAGSARLWTTPATDGIRVAVGCGARPARRPAGGAGDGGPAPEPAAGLPVTDAPVTTLLSGAIGFVGPAGRAVARYLVAQAACHYSPSDLALVVVSDRDDLACCHDLPHAAAAPDPSMPVGRAVGAAPPRRTLVVLDGPAALRSPLGVSALDAALSGADRSRVAVLCLADAPGMLPAHAVDIAAAACTPAGPLTLTGTSADLLRRICHALAPLLDHADADAVALPATVDLVDLIGPINADALRRRWGAQPTPAVVGCGAGGAVDVDLDRDGPHLLIAGTTGSGKSELLQTLITSLAVGASPQSVTFLLVDYKGGSAFGAIAELPHVVGVVTDLDPSGSARALASMRAELRRRERLESEGAPSAAKLVVVIDEFATLAAELPEFLAGVLDIAQRGRSLGLHLVLATQRPAGVVSPAMRANISARICLRVTDPAESLDVIGLPDAAALPAHRPGRAIGRFSGPVTEFQTALVSVPTPPDVSAVPVMSAAAATSKVSVTSAVTVTPAVPVTSPAAGAAGPVSILRAVITAACAAAADMPPPDRPWMEPLPTRIGDGDTDSGVLAIADVPDEQRRQPLAAPSTSTLILGPPGSGRSTALRRIAAISARADHELIVIDGSNALAGLAGWAQVSTYLPLYEPRLVSRCLTLLADPARRPPVGRLRHVVIDHLDLVLAALERSDYVAGSTVLTELLGRSAGSIRISASGTERLRHHSATAGFTERIELAGGALPGRGTWSGLHVQVVLPPVGTASAGAPAARRDSAAGASRPGSIVVRSLPRLAHAGSLPPPEPARVPFAIGGDAALPLAIDLTGPGGGIIVAGPRRSGVSNTLRVIAQQAVAARIRVVEVSAEPVTRPVPGVTHVSCQVGTAELTALLRAHDGPLLLLADHSGHGGDHPAGAVFERFLDVCRAGQYLLVGARTDAVLRSRRDHLRAVASYRQGLLLSPDQGDGAVLDLALPRRAGPVVPGRGVWAWDGIAAPAQVVLASGAAV